MQRPDGFGQPMGQGQQVIMGDPNNPMEGGPYKFSPEEMRVLNECNKEAFFKRCLPLSSLLGFGVYYGVRVGYLKGHPKYGSIPKVAGGIFFGYMAGKVSYQWKCAQKLMEVPNSKLGQVLREKRRAGKSGFQETLEPGFVGTGFSLPSTFSMKDEPLVEPDHQRSHLDLNDRPYNDFDFQRPPAYEGTNYELSGLPVEPPPHKVTYDELRKKNRDEYEIQRSKFIPRQPPPAPVNDLANPPAPSLAPPPMYSNPDSWSPSPGLGTYNDPWSK